MARVALPVRKGLAFVIMRLAVAACCALLLSATPAFAVTDDERVQVYREFRTLFDAKNYPAALILAQQLVELTETQYGPDDRQLVNPLTNVATTQLKLGNFPGAEEGYLRALKILELKAPTTDRQLFRPLQGLGTAYLAAKQFEAAVVPLKRALDLSRNIDGLFNANQLEYLFPLIEAYVATNRLQDAEKEHTYAFRVAETAFGKSDVRMVDPLDKLAGWYEYVGRYTTARLLHDRALAIVEKAGTTEDLRKVRPLRGIARTYRLEYLYGVENSEGSQGTDAFGNAIQAFESSQTGQLQRRGEQALRFAVAIVEKNTPVDQRLRGETVAELGDWFMVGGSTSRAMEFYRDAWRSLELAGNTQLLNAPRQLAYRASTFALERSKLDPELAMTKQVEARFTVTKDGKITDITSPTTDVNDAVVKAVINAVRRARYAPRIENGEPVDTPDVVYIEQVAVRNPAAPGAGSPSP